jgi:iron complex transport system ATP-binding protein
MKGRDLFTLEEVAFVYGTQAVLSGISFPVEEGEMVAIIGPNGAGKSTLLRILSGFLKPTAGTVRFRGKEVGGYEPKELARLVATLPHGLDIPFSYSVEEFVLMGRYTHSGGGPFYDPADHREVARAMAMVGIGHLGGRRMDALSEGERQRVLLAQCLAQTPHVLLLDEPVSHLDIRHQLRTLELLEDLHGQGLTILMILHDLNLAAEFCSRIILLSKGRVYADGPPEAVLNYENIEAVYESVVIVRENPISRRPFILPVSRKFLP